MTFFKEKLVICSRVALLLFFALKFTELSFLYMPNKVFGHGTSDASLAIGCSLNFHSEVMDAKKVVKSGVMLIIKLCQYNKI